MNFETLITQRQSVRKYTDKPVEPEKIRQCIEAAQLAPSACNSQPWTFVVVTEHDLRKKVANETLGPLNTFNKFVLQAPVIIVLVMEKPKLIAEMGGRIKNKEYPLIDIGIAAEHICLQATELGLGSCMLGWFNEKPIQDLLNIPADKTIGLLISLGYAPESYKQRKKIRKSLDELIRFNRY